ncbi:hypothetical protein BKI52_07370 [marine bacterium AO1-C]|nr:hypothetical protein BKI52_07370 [marine bacterium AO1-C]
MNTRKTIRDGEFITLIAFLMAMVAFAINMILPAFKDMTKDLGLNNETHIQLSVSLLYLGLAIGQVFYGALSDNTGRKRSIYIGLLLFMGGCLISFVAPNLTILIIGQIVQGMGLGAPRVVTMAIVRDNYSGNAMGRVMSFIMMIFILVPTISPYLGQSIILLTHWRVLFLVFIGLAVGMLLWLKIRLPESLDQSQRTSFSLSQVYKTILFILKTPAALGYTVVLGLFSSAFIAYLNMSQQVFQIQYDLGKQYPLYFALLSLSIGLASFTNGKWVLRYGMEKLSKVALIATCTIAIPTFLWIWFTATQPPFGFLMFFMTIVLYCFGILVGNLNSLAMKPLGHVAGTGAAIVGALSTLVSVPFAIWIGSYYAGSILPLVGGFALFGSLSLALFLKITSLKQTLDYHPH